MGAAHTDSAESENSTAVEGDAWAVMGRMSASTPPTVGALGSELLLIGKGCDGHSNMNIFINSIKEVHQR